jgi:cold shock CspA family protein
MLKGVFIWWSSDKGFGLIEAEGARFYAHILNVDQKSGLPRTGDSCTFEVSDRPRRVGAKFAEALNIQVGGAL